MLPLLLGASDACLGSRTLEIFEDERATLSLPLLAAVVAALGRYQSRLLPLAAVDLLRRTWVTSTVKRVKYASVAATHRLRLTSNLGPQTPLPFNTAFEAAAATAARPRTSYVGPRTLTDAAL